MAQLKFSRLAVRIHIIRDGRSAQPNRFPKHLLNSVKQPMKFAVFEFLAEAHGMNPRAPEAFVRVDIPDAPHNVLIEEKRFDACAPRANGGMKFFLACFERVQAEFPEKTFARAICKNPDAPEPANVGVAQLAAIIEHEKHVSMRSNAGFRGTRHNLPSHAEVNLKRELRAGGNRALEIQQEKFSEAAHGSDPATRQIPLDGRGIINEICFPQTHAEDAPPRQHSLQSAGDGLDFRQFRHIISHTN